MYKRTRPGKADGWIITVSLHTSNYFIIRILSFSAIFVFMQFLLDYRRAAETSILSIGWYLVAGIALGSVLFFTYVRLPYHTVARVGIGWIALFIIQEFSNIVEGVFFTTYVSTASLFFVASLMGLLVTFVEASAAAWLFRSKETAASFWNSMRMYLGQRSWRSWVLRIAIGSLAYFPIYFTFGALISPFVLPYYQNSSTELRIPSLAVMVPLEFVRGFLYVIALFPLFAALQTRKKYTYVGIVALLYVAGAFVPFLSGPTLPAQLKIIHGMEILADCLAYGAVLTHLFTLQRPSL